MDGHFRFVEYLYYAFKGARDLRSLIETSM